MHRRPRTPPRWSARTARSTGCACPASTPPPASRRCSATDEHGHWQLVPGRRLPSAAAATSATRRCWRPRSPPTPGSSRSLDVMPTGDDRGRRRPPGHRRRGHGPDAPRVGGPVRLRQGPAVGAPRRRRRRAGDHRGRRPGPAGPARPAAAGRRRTTATSTSSTSREGEELTFSTTWVPVAPPQPEPPATATTGSRRRSASSTRRWADRCTSTAVPRRRRRPALAAHAAPAHPRRHRRHRRGRRPPRCPRTSAASATGTTATAGCATPPLTLELAARGRLRRGGPALARLAAARGRRRPGGPADHVRRRRLAAPARARPSTTCPGTPARAGADRQRRGRPAPDRRARRGDDRPRDGRAPSALDEDDDAWSLQRVLVDHLGRAPGRSRTTGCGRSAGRCGTSPTPG